MWKSELGLGVLATELENHRLPGRDNLLWFGTKRIDNAALFAAEVIGLRKPEVIEKIRAYKEKQKEKYDVHLAAKDGKVVELTA